ncbi:PDZ domain-containing protein [Thermomonas sp. RSS23]|uniref:PDZ domain-containing protein n=1 Tax=Thermomonas beijingensis TaxID=2872701 RepID=A0ABS7TH81_9GAMM|nr:PDZ domain-containing protein [Thermomonas beijingensis]MBZ4187221.1 PDZ domain-containing protein [Thermomonas beijingensis]
MRVLLKALFVLAFLAASMPTEAGKVLLGFTVHYTVKQATAFDAKLDRVVVTKVKEKSPAMRAGLMPGDVIELLNGAVVSGNSARKLDKEMSAIQARDIVKMTVLRSGKRVAISMVAGET